VKHEFEGKATSWVPGASTRKASDKSIALLHAECQGALEDAGLTKDDVTRITARDAPGLALSWSIT